MLDGIDTKDIKNVIIPTCILLLIKISFVYGRAIYMFSSLHFTPSEQRKVVGLNSVFVWPAKHSDT